MGDDGSFGNVEFTMPTVSQQQPDPVVEQVGHAICVPCFAFAVPERGFAHGIAHDHPVGDGASS